MLTHFKRFTFTNVKGLVYEGFSKVTPLEWQKLINHVEEKVENHYWRADELNEELLEHFIINTDSDTSDSSDSSNSDSDSGEDDGSMEESDAAEYVSVL